MSTRPWTPRTWVVVVASSATSSTAMSFAMRGVWWPLLVLGGIWIGMGIVAWWLWRQERIDREIERQTATRRRARNEEA